MRFPCPEIHQVNALSAQFRSFRSHCHGCGNLNPANPVGKYLGRCSHCHSASIFTDLRSGRNVPIGFFWMSRANLGSGNPKS
jgi:hypothetical protein